MESVSNEVQTAQMQTEVGQVEGKKLYDDLVECARFLEPVEKKKQKVVLGPRSVHVDAPLWTGKWKSRQEKYQDDQSALSRFCIFFWSYMSEQEPLMEVEKFLSLWMSTILLFKKDWKKEDFDKDFEFYWKFIENKTTASEYLTDVSITKPQKVTLYRMIMINLVTRLQHIITNAPKTNGPLQVYKWCCPDDQNFAHTENPIYRLPLSGSNDPLSGRPFNSFYYQHKTMFSGCCESCISKSSIIQMSIPQDFSFLLVSDSLCPIEKQGKILLPFGSIMSLSSVKAQACSFFTVQNKVAVDREVLPASYTNVANIGVKQYYKQEESSIKELVLRVYKAHLVKPRDLDRLADGDVPAFAEITREQWLHIAEIVECETPKNTGKTKLMAEIFSHIEKTCKTPSFGQIARFMFMMKTFIVYSNFKFSNIPISEKDFKALFTKESLATYFDNFFENWYKKSKPAVKQPEQQKEATEAKKPEVPRGTLVFIGEKPATETKQPESAPAIEPIAVVVQEQPVIAQPEPDGKQEAPIVNENTTTEPTEDLLDL